ncbi:MmpS family transport accessory protein [Actinomadura montaniterrae]|uniref:DUF3558 domain-containing protein n=1 Tax=Actinomadura montaniterrae TaxID=1803903 RepID=A0A6L3VKG0_9ACTN|nr:MmpS family transport accessory protein [Actinomadura montaniterrae]KAB2360221.1 hypothetical protein F9B16_46390 [Actinomadura montaniterrae]
MRRGCAIRTIAAGGALALALSGCGGGGGKDKASGAGKPPLKPAGQATAPAGGWPQPENGRLTAKMCGLLTDGDYAKYGHQRMPQEDAGPAQDGSNAVYCTYMLGDQLNLSLQKSAQGAKIAFKQGLDDHRDRLKGKQSVLAPNVVQGADESWFDYSTLGGGPSEYEVEARRGGLIVGIVLSEVPQHPDKDPKGMLAALAALVLQRIPDVGKADTGIVHQVKYVVWGSGGAAMQLVYSDPVNSKSVTLKNVKLPWHKEFPMPDTGDQPTAALSISGAAASPTAFLGCEVLVDGKPVQKKDPSSGMVFCDAMYHG